MRYFREILVRNLIHGIVGIYHVDPYSSQKNQGFQLFDFLGGWLSGEAPHKSPNVHRVMCVNFASSSTGGLTMFVCMGLSPIATNPHSSSWILHIAMQILITSHLFITTPRVLQPNSPRPVPWLSCRRAHTFPAWCWSRSWTPSNFDLKIARVFWPWRYNNG